MVFSVFIRKKAYVAYHASGKRGTGRPGLRVYPAGKKAFICRNFVGASVKFQTLGYYPEIPLSVAFAQFDSLAESNYQKKSVTESRIIQNGDISSKHYDRYDYVEEKMEAVVKLETVLLSLI